MKVYLVYHSFPYEGDDVTDSKVFYKLEDAEKYKKELQKINGLQDIVKIKTTELL